MQKTLVFIEFFHPEFGVKKALTAKDETDIIISETSQTLGQMSWGVRQSSMFSPTFSEQEPGCRGMDVMPPSYDARGRQKYRAGHRPTELVGGKMTAAALWDV